MNPEGNPVYDALRANTKARAIAVLEALSEAGATPESVAAALAPAVRETGGIFLDRWARFSRMMTDTSGETVFKPVRAYPIFIGAGADMGMVWVFVAEDGGGAAIFDEADMLLPVAELTSMVVGAALEAALVRQGRPS
ncbi:hypothetical protein GC169_01605 [bacterium]|nr:hypothetical protein [bacterium]